MKSKENKTIDTFNTKWDKFREVVDSKGYMDNQYDWFLNRYGWSEKTFLKDLKNSKSAAMLIAQIFWYFIEGFSFRVSDDDFSDETQYVIYKVPIEDEILMFKKSNKTGRWWIELPFFSNVNNKLKRETLLPCTYGDYLSACNQEIPERWIKARRKNEL